jgi:hypothetical protein
MHDTIPYTTLFFVTSFSYGPAGRSACLQNQPLALDILTL